jgi:hypothetical protein
LSGSRLRRLQFFPGSVKLRESTGRAGGLPKEVIGGNAYSDWRLPATLPVNGTEYQYAISYNGSSDIGFNITNSGSEMAYLYYVSLGNKAYYDSAGNPQIGWGLIKTDPFLQLRQGSYWSSSECPTCPGGFFGFDFYGGGQAIYSPAGRNEYNLAIAVRPGDVTPVPIPGAVWLFGSGIILVAGKIIRDRRGGISR